MSFFPYKSIKDLLQKDPMNLYALLFFVYLSLRWFVICDRTPEDFSNPLQASKKSTPYGNTNPLGFSIPVSFYTIGLLSHVVDPEDPEKRKKDSLFPPGLFPRSQIEKITL